MNDTTQQPMSDEQFATLEQQFPDNALVERYLEIRRFLEAETEAQAAHIKPHTDNMVAIANELHRRLLKRNPNWQPGMKASGSTEHGTFFLKTDNSLRVADRNAFFDWIAAEPGVRLHRFATAHVAKEGVESYVEEIEQYRRGHGGALPPGVTSALPPGITLERITKLQVRKI